MSRELVTSFLAALEQRDISRANSFLGEGMRMTFPGGKCMRDLDEFVEWSSHRYRSVTKTFEVFDQLQDGDTTVVYCMGVLNGTRLDGGAISGVRFIDRFEIRDGRIVDQQVWNDLAEVMD